MIHLDAAGHPNWARISADRQTAMTATRAIVSKATYRQNVNR